MIRNIEFLKQTIVVSLFECTILLGYGRLIRRSNIIDTFATHLIIIIKSEVSTFPIFVIFFRGCVWSVCTIICYMYIPKIPWTYHLLKDHSQYKATGVLVRSWSMWTSPHHLISAHCPYVCSALSILNIKHTYLILWCEMTGARSESN